MHPFYIVLLGGITGFSSDLLIYWVGSSQDSLPLFLWFLPGILLALVLIGLRGRTNWWRYALALLLCAAGYPLGYLVGLGVGFGMTMLVGYALAESFLWYVFVLVPAFIAAGAVGGALVALAWSVLYQHWSIQVLRRSLWVGGLLALTVLLPSPVPFWSPFLTFWCPGMLLLANSWTRSLNNPARTQPQAQSV